MADYDCEYCSKSVSEGGKCTHFEYNCPFNVVKKYTSDELKSMREAIKKISEAIEELKKLDTEEYLDDEINSVSFQLSLLEDKVDEDTEKEWNAIKD